MELLKTVKSELETYFNDIKVSGFCASIVSIRNKTSLCVMFPQIREATSNEFYKLRELCNEYDLVMVEDQDTTSRNTTQYFYIFTQK